MMDLVKDYNFKFVATYGVGAPNEPYKTNQTRYHSSSVVHTALAAAEINKKQKSLRLSVFQGIYKNSLREQLNSEIKVAFEMAHAANSIFAGSVSGLIFPSTAGFYQLFDMGEILSNVSKMARNQGLKFGVRNQAILRDLRSFYKEVITDILKVEENMRGMRKRDEYHALNLYRKGSPWCTDQQNKLRIAQVLKLFRSPNAKKGYKKQPRGAVKSNSVFVFAVDSTTESKYWLYDGHRWDNRGTMIYLFPDSY
ncbi:hypothetical protein Ocin01_18842 [Orchesella cincta]|uniref:Uncharacterized protein n=1 Tax=Orchesella cincta TaxID=48709 RepID=A0A1D2M4K7_ORCCI|nr:hypothetical protein Ocin01_18842 [Orchesella cincta]